MTRWRSVLAQCLLALALAIYVITLPALLRQFTDGPLSMDAVLYTVGGWAMAPALVLALAGIAEYLSRIADALTRIAVAAEKGKPA